MRTPSMRSPGSSSRHGGSGSSCGSATHRVSSRSSWRFAGLEDVLLLEPLGEAEQREQPLRVEEERQLGDPAPGELDHL